MLFDNTDAKQLHSAKQSTFVSSHCLSSSSYL